MRQVRLYVYYFQSGDVLVTRTSDTWAVYRSTCASTDLVSVLTQLGTKRDWRIGVDSSLSSSHFFVVLAAMLNSFQDSSITVSLMIRYELSICMVTDRSSR